MRRINIFLFLFVCVIGQSFAQQTGYWGDQGDGTYRNPIIAADFCDPDPLRVGDDYYMVSSTFESSPGVTVLHSRDLVNWEIIGGVFDDLQKVDSNFSARKMNRYGEGIYAPSIRYHDGLFYVYVNLHSDGMYFATAKDPAGKWDYKPLKDKYGKPLTIEGWTDPCPFWDDNGKAYLVSSNPGKIWYGYMFQMTPDGSQLLDADANHMKEKSIVYKYPNGGTVYSPNFSTEGNKIFKRNGYYYINHIEFLDGGHGTGSYVYRSKNIYGTKVDGTPGTPGDIGQYEMIRFDPYYQGYQQRLPGQGGFVDTPDGKWYWIGQFNLYGADGRVPCLLPVTWIDGWPIIGDSIQGHYGKMVWQYIKPIKSEKIILPQGSDDFSSPNLKKFWAWNHQPMADKWSLTERKGFMRLHATKTIDGSENFFKATNTMEQRLMSSESVVITVKMDIRGMTDGQRAALANYNGGGSYALCGVMMEGTDKYIFYHQKGDIVKGVRLPEHAKSIYIRSMSKFVPRHFVYQFSSEGQHYAYSFDGKKYVPFGDEYQMSTYGFRGDRVGICTYNNKNDRGYIDIDRFDYKIKNRK
jgi:beta-xylosidase